MVIGTISELVKQIQARHPPTEQSSGPVQYAARMEPKHFTQAVKEAEKRGYRWERTPQYLATDEETRNQWVVATKREEGGIPKQLGLMEPTLLARVMTDLRIRKATDQEAGVPVWGGSYQGVHVQVTYAPGKTPIIREAEYLHDPVINHALRAFSAQPLAIRISGDVKSSSDVAIALYHAQQQHDYMMERLGLEPRHRVLVYGRQTGWEAAITGLTLYESMKEFIGERPGNESSSVKVPDFASVDVVTSDSDLVKTVIRGPERLLPDLLTPHMIEKKNVEAPPTISVYSSFVELDLRRTVATSGQYDAAISLESRSTLENSFLRLQDNARLFAHLNLYDTYLSEDEVPVLSVLQNIVKDEDYVYCVGDPVSL